MTREEFLAAVNLLDQNGDFGVVPGPLGERINFTQGFPLSIVIGSLQVNSVASLGVSTFFGRPLLVIGRAADVNVTVTTFEAITAVIGPIENP
jgi:hypothetical protein